TSLELHHARVGDDGMKDVARMEKLQTLGLSLTGISNKGLKELSVLKNLQSLDLSRTQDCTDEWIPQLVDLKRLRFLNVFWTELTDPGVKELHKRMPACSIYYYYR